MGLVEFSLQEVGEFVSNQAERGWGSDLPFSAVASIQDDHSTPGGDPAPTCIYKQDPQAAVGINAR